MSARKSRTRAAVVAAELDLRKVSAPRLGYRRNKTKSPRGCAAPPRASMPSIHELATFMMALCSGKNTRGGRGFVKK
eukprot:1114132-Pleurochrysis_carterae.AAC.1